MNRRMGSSCVLASILVGCAAAPTGPEFAKTVLPTPGDNESIVIVFRDYAEPTALAAKIDIDGKQVFELSQKSFAFTTGEPGAHSFSLRWPSASGTPGVQTAVEWQPRSTYYYQLTGTSGNGWHFESQLKPLDEGLAKTMLKSCCKLMTAQTGVQQTDQLMTTQVGKRDVPDVEKASFFAKVTTGMSPEQVLGAVGAPDQVSSKSTGKKGVPFYFGSDTRRESWSYTGIGFVVFTRNEYTASLKVVETKYDKAAP